MSVIISSDFVQTLTKLANESFMLAFVDEPVVYPQLFEVIDVNERYDGRTFGQFTEIIGEGEPRQIGYTQDHNFDDDSEGYSSKWSLKPYQRGVMVTQDMIDNWTATQVIDYVSEKSSSLGIGAARGRDRFCAGMFNNGMLTAGSTAYFDGSKGDLQADANLGFIYTGQPWFDTAHALKLSSGTTFSNHTASAAFTATTLESALILMETTDAKGERNEEIENPMDTILGPPNLEFDILRVMTSALKPGTGNNDRNVLQERLKPVFWRKLTNTAGWYIGAARKGLKFLHKGVPVIKRKVDEFSGTGVIYLSIVDEYTGVVTQWRNWSCQNIAAA